MTASNLKTFRDNGTMGQFGANKKSAYSALSKKSTNFFLSFFFLLDSFNVQFNLLTCNAPFLAPSTRAISFNSFKFSLFNQFMHHWKANAYQLSRLSSRNHFIFSLTIIIHFVTFVLIQQFNSQSKCSTESIDTQGILVYNFISLLVH